MHASHTHPRRPCHAPATFTSTPSTRASDPDLRVDDDARRAAATALGVHLAAGRLDLTEYEERLDRAFAARVHRDLTGVLADLPRVTTPADRARQRAAARGTVGTWLALCALFLTIWALTGADYFWPVWPMMGTGIAFLPTAWALWTGQGARQ